MHAVAARSRFGSEKCESTPCSDHFLTIRLPFDVEKVHTACWREADLEVKRVKNCGFKPILMCQMSFI